MSCNRGDDVAAEDIREILRIRSEIEEALSEIEEALRQIDDTLRRVAEIAKVTPGD